MAATREKMRELFESDGVAETIREAAKADLKRATDAKDALEKQMAATLQGRQEAHWQKRAGLLKAALPVVRTQREIVLAQAEREEMRKTIESLDKQAAGQREEAQLIEKKFEYAKLQERFGQERKALVKGKPCPLCGATIHPGADVEFDAEYLVAITAICSRSMPMYSSASWTYRLTADPDSQLSSIPSDDTPPAYVLAFSNPTLCRLFGVITVLWFIT